MNPTMEQHPVPQNVTTFQFRLVGDMTIKQFGYLAGGIILGYIFYKLPLPFFFTWPLGVGSAVLGFGLAFVPVEERPMDIWIASFFKNVYSPTQYIWHKTPTQPIAATPPASPTQPREPPTQPKPPKKTAPSKPFEPMLPVSQKPTGGQTVWSLHYGSNPLGWLKDLFRPTPKISLSPGLEFADALTERQAPSSPPNQPQITPAPAVASQQSQVQQPTAHQRLVELQTQLSDSLAQREQLEKELVLLRARSEEHQRPAPPMRTASVVPGAMQPATTVRVIAPQSAVRAGLPRLTTFPNVVTGIVKDHLGNLLPGMLITVRDGSDTPVRALKTNKLGQFAASTPLPNGTYIVEIEDPKGMFTFDKAQMLLTSAILPPLEVTAKSQKQIERDKLAREIFGQNQI